MASAREESGATADDSRSLDVDVALDQWWERRGLDPSTLTINSSGTIESMAAPGADGPQTPAARDLEDLPRLLEPGRAHLVRGAELGVGGMGVVRTATQAGLQRQVAVKELRQGRDAARLGAMLIQEARVTGAIAHPNVVPVHLLGRDPDGHPMMVMERVEGRAWRDVLREESVAGDRSSLIEPQRLERNLRVLIQVAHAVHHAHSKYILHRDLKPANVVLGQFGQVYVVDWALAVGLKRDVVAGVPLALHENTVAGTPAYMAPEMAAGLGDKLGVWTDVYLLGATLFEILTGRPPHRGKTVTSIMRAAYVSEPPTFDAFVPDGISRICAKAMSRMPADRHSDVDAFRRAVEGWLAKASDARLLAEAEERLGRLHDLIDLGEPGHEPEIQTLFGQCRFAFDHAGTVEAREARDAAIELMIRHELRSGNAPAAASLITELPSPDETLRARVAAELETTAQTRRRLRELEHHLDITVGDRLRARIALSVMVVFTVSNLALGTIYRGDVYRLGYLEYGLLVLGCLIATVAAQRRWRSVLMEHRVNRRVTTAVLVMLAHDAAVWPVCYALELPMVAGMVFMALIAASTWGYLALSVDRVLAVSAAAFALAVPLMLLLPDWMFECMALGGFIGQGGSALGWLHRRSESPVEWR